MRSEPIALSLGSLRRSAAGVSRNCLMSLPMRSGFQRLPGPACQRSAISYAAGALAVIRYAKIHGIGHRPWLTALLARRPTKVAAIALANKIARMAWAMMARGERYREPVALAA